MNLTLSGISQCTFIAFAIWSFFSLLSIYAIRDFLGIFCWASNDNGKT